METNTNQTNQNGQIITAYSEPTNMLKEVREEFCPYHKTLFRHTYFFRTEAGRQQFLQAEAAQNAGGGWNTDYKWDEHRSSRLT